MMVAETSPKMIMAVLGLGNPGRRYAKSRHNFGYMVLDRLAFLKKKEFIRSERKFDYCHATISEIEIILAKPTTFMNNSGQAALGLCQDFGIRPDALLVVCDDCNLPPGKIRFRSKGSDGGHNGLESIISVLETRDFPRLRLGIGLNPQDVPLEQYVLENFDQEELPTVEKVVDKTSELIEEFALKGYQVSSKTITLA